MRFALNIMSYLVRLVRRVQLALRYYNRLRYSWHLAWQKAAR